MAIALMFGVQAVDLRTRIAVGHYDARANLSPATLPLYLAVREVVGRPPAADRPYIRIDNEQPLSAHIALIAADIVAGGVIPRAVGRLAKDLFEALAGPRGYERREP
jgi:phenylalanine ammonia-lyase